MSSMAGNWQSLLDLDAPGPVIPSSCSCRMVQNMIDDNNALIKKWVQDWYSTDGSSLNTVNMNSDTISSSSGFTWKDFLIAGLILFAVIMVVVIIIILATTKRSV